MAVYQKQDIEVLPTKETNIQQSTGDTIIRESTPLLTSEIGQTSRRCCLKSSAAILILVWNLCAAIGLEFFLFGIPLFTLTGTYINLSWRVFVHGVFTIYLLFIPLAGYLADTYWGRHKTIFGSMRFILLSIVLVLVLGILVATGSVVVAITNDSSSLSIMKKVSISLLCLTFGPPILFGILLIVFSLVAFNANVIQHGVDQVAYDTQGEDFTLYICWYIWTCYLAKFIVKIPFTVLGVVSLHADFGIFLIVLPIMIAVTLCVKKWNEHWIFVDTEPQNLNPYKLICQTIKFVVSHKNFLHFRTFNYNDNDLRSRFDLGKEKYGGPFTTSQMEDVKSFWRIFGIFLSLGPALMVDIAVRDALPNLVFHMDGYGLFETVLNRYDDDLYYQKYNLLKSHIFSGDLTPLIIVVMLPLYIGIL